MGMIIDLIITLFLVILNGYFVGSEFALVRMRASSAEKLAKEKKFGSNTLKNDILPNLDNYLAVTQIGITIASLALGSIGEHALSKLLNSLLPSQYSSIVPAFSIFIISFLLITYLHVVFGELAPKTMAIQRAETFSRLTAKPMKFFYYLFLPGIIIFNGSSNMFTKLFGIEPASETEEVLSEEEIITILKDSNTGNKIDKDELKMIERIFRLDDKKSSDIMTPIEEITKIKPSHDVNKMREIVEEKTYQRYPVIGEKLHGFIDVRQITSIEGKSNKKAKDIVKNLPKIKQEMPLDNVIRKIQKENREILAVENEENEVIGIVTSEDIIEEIIGDVKSYFEEYRTVEETKN